VNRREGETVRRNRDAVSRGLLEQPFGLRDMNDALGIHWAGTFLPKHRVGNPGGYTHLFVQVSSLPAPYRLASS